MIIVYSRFLSMNYCYLSGSLCGIFRRLRFNVSFIYGYTAYSVLMS